MFIVVYEDDMATTPYAMEADGSGALELLGEKDAVALFNSRDDAKRAIRISRKVAELQKAQGAPYSNDFMYPGVLCVKIRECALVESSKEGSDHAR